MGRVILCRAKTAARDCEGNQTDCIGTGIMLIVMLVVYAVLGRFTIGVLLGGLLGSAYAIFNFFMLGMTLQKAAAMTDQQMAHMKVRSSYSTRMVGMLVLAVLAFALPFVEGIPCLIALLFSRAPRFLCFS